MFREPEIGDCFVASFNLLMHGESYIDFREERKPGSKWDSLREILDVFPHHYLAHGVVWNGHKLGWMTPAWVEVYEELPKRLNASALVIDLSSKRFLVMERGNYYALAKMDFPPVTYTQEKALAQVMDDPTYGPWEVERTELDKEHEAQMARKGKIKYDENGDVEYIPGG